MACSRTISGVFPVDEYYRDAIVMGVESGTWRELGICGGIGRGSGLGRLWWLNIMDVPCFSCLMEMRF